MKLVVGKRSTSSSSSRLLFLALALLAFMRPAAAAAAAAAAPSTKLRGTQANGPEAQQLVDAPPQAPAPVAPASDAVVAPKHEGMDDGGDMPPPPPVADMPKPTCPGENQCPYNCGVDDEGELTCFCGLCPDQ